MNAHLSRLHRRNVQNIVEKRQQVICRMAGRVNVFPLAGIQASSLQQSEHAQNAVEGRAQLMTHVCQKLALAPVRLLCCCIGCLQTFG